MTRTLRTGEFHGTRRDTYRHEGLTLAESEYVPGHSLPKHAHEHAFFSLLLRGTFDERLYRGSRTCIPTSVVFYPENEPHSEEFGADGGRSFNVELGPAWASRLREYGMTYAPGSTETRASRLNFLTTRLYAWFLEDGPEVGADELVWEMMAELARVHRLGHESSPPPWLDLIRSVLHARFREVVPVSELADEADVHPVHAARVFRRYCGCTIGEYVRRLRVEHACAALAHSRTALSAIALDVGFSDQAHFTRRFKELTGMPPGLYRRVVSD